MDKREDTRTGNFCPKCGSPMYRDGKKEEDYCDCGYIELWEQKGVTMRYKSIMSFQPGLPSREYVDFCSKDGMYLILTQHSVYRFDDFQEASQEFDRKVERIKKGEGK